MALSVYPCLLGFSILSSLVMSTYVQLGYGYRVRSVNTSTSGEELHLLLELNHRSEAIYGPDIKQLQMRVSYETSDRLHIHITDVSEARWEIPQQLIPRKQEYFSRDSNTRYHHVSSFHGLQFSHTTDPFGFAITRRTTKEVLFNSTAPHSQSPFSNMVFKDQYLEISTVIPRHASLYGLGDSNKPDGLRLQQNRTYTLWTIDALENQCHSVNTDLYGAHPFYLDVRKDGLSHGVLLLNSNGMDISYGTNFLTYRIVGGILDFYFFVGPQPLSVIQQYTELVGRPAPMPYWSLGFHQCRYGYKNVEDVEAVVAGYRAANIPLDVMWNDIDYMDRYKDFTLDAENYPADKFHAYVQNLHANDQHFVLIVDPGIHIDEEYSTFVHGLEKDIFIKHGGKPYLAQLWPGVVYFPDFLHPNISAFWTSEISNFHEIIPFDGLWIDMNEVSNLCSGTTCTYPKDAASCLAMGQCCLNCSDDDRTRWDDPPYKINSACIHRAIGMKTVATSAVHYNGVLEYNAHNLYGLSEAIVTHQALKKVLMKRPFVLCRSTYSASGSYVAHWTGDNAATWNDLAYSLVAILNSGLFGVPMVGSDICGFKGDTTEELCNRWIQLGAFYPFSRNHADMGSRRQELYLWDSVAHSARKALGLRYQLLPYLYTLGFEAHKKGSPIARPLFFSFPHDPSTQDIDKQFLLGRGVLVSPVLSKGATSLTAYFPEGIWYNLLNLSQVISMATASYQTIPAPWDTINVHVLGGTILPMQGTALTTVAAQKTPFSLLIAFPLTDSGSNEQVSASGQLFLDNGDEIEMEVVEGKSTFVEFHATRSYDSVQVTSTVTFGGFALKKGWIVDKMVILGMKASLFTDVSVVVNGKADSGSVKTQLDWEGSSISISNLNLRIGKSLDVLLEMKTTAPPLRLRGDVTL